MAMPFSRSMRSLNADNYRGVLISLMIAMPLFTAWLSWFFLADVAITEMSTTVQVKDEEYVLASFSENLRTQILPGQTALLRLNTMESGYNRTIPAVVSRIKPSEEVGLIQVELFAFEPLPATEDISTLIKQVEVEIEHVSPVTLILRATGQSIETPPLVTSPRDT